MRRAVGLLPLFVALLPGSAAPGQELHRTPDGSRFLLLPAAGPPLVHWAIASPAGPMEEPIGMEGLSWAVLVASLYGTTSIGTLDAEREGLALERIATLERSLAAVPSDEQLETQLAAARREAAALRDAGAFRRVLAAAPAVELRIHRAPQAGLLLLGTVPEGVERVAELLRERRDENRLRALDVAFAGVRAEEGRYLDDPLRALQSEAVALAFPGHVYSRAAPREAGAAGPQRDAAWKVWRSTQRPERCLHVLTGNFDPGELRTILDRTFARSAPARPDQPGGEPEPEPPPRWPSEVQRATVPLSGTPAVVLALPAPDVGRATLLWAADLLAGGAESVLAEALRQRGRQQAKVRWTGPVPGGRPGACLLVSVEDPKPGEGLGNDCLAALADVAERLRNRPSLAAVEGRRRAEANAVTGDPRAQARWLATHLLHSSDPEAEARALLGGPAAGDVYAAAMAAVEGIRPVVVEGQAR